MDIRLKAEYERRIQNTRLEAAKRGFEALIIVGLAPRRTGDLMYLCGHQPMLPGHPRRFGFRGRGCSAIFLPIVGDPVLLATTPFYERDLYIQDVRYEDDLPANIAQTVTERGLERADIGIVGMDVLAAALYGDLCRALPHVYFSSADDIVMNLRAAKSPYEIELLSKGARIGDEVGELLRDYLRPGLTELQVYQFITQELSSRGVTGAFATCQSGWRSETAYDLVPASPDKVLEDGDMVHMEINGKLDGYMIDICRSTVIGRAKPEQIEILETVLEMLEQSVAAMKPGVIAEDLEQVSGRIALEHGFVKNHTRAFHGPATYLGHAIGLGVDEPPVLAKGDQTILVPGMVITVEPGLYQTGFGGCRIEDEILVTETGTQVLNACCRRWW